MEIVKVSQEDYEKVMDINFHNVYDGTDYLPDYFNMLLAMPNVEAYAVAIDGKFVSFALYTIVDEGKTLVTRAGRTDKNFLGRKYHSLLHEHMLKYSVFGPKLEYTSGTGGNHVKGMEMKIQDGTLRKVLQREFRYYGCYRADTFLDQLNDKKAEESVATLLQEPDILELLDNNTFCARLFPERLFMVDWVPYCLLKSNVPLLMIERTTAVGSKLQDSEHALLTFAHYFRATRGLVCNVDVYGHISSALIDHLYIHFENIPIFRSEKIVIRCFSKDDTDWNFVSSLMNDVSLNKQGILGSGVVCYRNKNEEITSKL